VNRRSGRPGEKSSAKPGRWERTVTHARTATSPGFADEGPVQPLRLTDRRTRLQVAAALTAMDVARILSVRPKRVYELYPWRAHLRKIPLPVAAGATGDLARATEGNHMSLYQRTTGGRITSKWSAGIRATSALDGTTIKAARRRWSAPSHASGPPAAGFWPLGGGRLTCRRARDYLRSPAALTPGRAAR